MARIKEVIWIAKDDIVSHKLRDNAANVIEVHFGFGMGPFVSWSIYEFGARRNGFSSYYQKMPSHENNMMYQYLNIDGSVCDE